MIILGIDPGTATTGFALIEKKSDGKWSAVDFGVIATDAKLSENLRLLEIFSDIEKIIKKYKPSLAGVEKLFFSNNQKTAMAVSASRGVVMLLLAKHNIPMLEFTPLQVKSQMCGYGQARKPQVQRAVQRAFALASPPRPDDAADALALAFCAGVSRRVF